MPYLNDLDCGGFGYDTRSGASGKGLFPKHDIGRQSMFAGKEIVWPQTTIAPIEEELIFVRSAALGGFAAGSPQATTRLIDQIQEIVNFHQHPVFIQWESAGGIIRINSRDGWYLIEQALPDLEEIAQGIVPIQLRCIRISPQQFRRIGTGFDGGPIKATSFTGITAVNWIPCPVGSTSLLSSVTRTGSEGAFPVCINPLSNPATFVPGTIAQMFLGGARVWDAEAVIATNPVPTDGTAAHANWTEAKGPTHRFVGDIVMGNTLYMVTLAPGSSPGIVLYFWNTQLSPAAWQQYGTLNYKDSSGNVGTLRQISVLRVGPEQVEAYVRISTSAGNICEGRLRLRRGGLTGVDVEFNPLTEGNSNAAGLSLVLNYNQKISWNNHSVADVITQGTVNQPVQTDSGYAASIGTSGVLCIAGILYLNGPDTGQPNSTTAGLGIGETLGPGQNIIRRYSFFAFPFPTPQNLQSEAESGTLSGGFASTADTGSSGGNVAKLSSAAGSGAIALWGTAWQPPVGTYKMFVRMRSTNGTSTTAQMQIGVWNSTDSTYVGSATYSPSQVATGYGGALGGGWYEVATVTLPAGKNIRFRAVSTATATDDWWIDEAVLVPSTNTTGDFPQDLSAQYLYDRSSRRVVDE